MNGIHKLTLRSMKLNKKRTIVTILGIIISVAMFTAVSTVFFSFQDLMIRYSYEEDGKYHGVFHNIPSENLDIITKDKEISYSMLSVDVGQGTLEGQSKPYVNVSSYDEKAYENLPLKIVEGRYPINDSEVVIPQMMKQESKDKFKLGDTITIPMGVRKIDESVYREMFGYGEDDEIDNAMVENGVVTLPADEHYISKDIGYGSGETFEKDGTTKQYTIVGVVEEQSYRFAFGPSYPLYTYLDKEKLSADDSLDVYVFLNQLNKESITHLRSIGMEATGGIDTFAPRTTIFVLSGATSDDGFNTMLFILGGILFLIIMVGSVSLIYNSFAISLSERSRQLGMLASIGATKRQKQSSVFYEGFVVAAISIPLGIIAGFFGIWVTFLLMNPLFKNLFDLNVDMKVIIRFASIIISFVMAVITIFISAYIPARKASRITPMDAIRQTKDIKLTNAQVKIPKMVKKLFGFEGEVALKNLKRYKKRYQATVFSLAISIILFLTASSYAFYLKNSFGMAQTDAKYDVSISPLVTGSNILEDVIPMVKDLSSVKEFAKVTYPNMVLGVNGQDDQDLFTKEYKDQLTLMKEELMNGQDNSQDNSQDTTESELYPQIELVGLDDQSYESFAKELGIPAGELSDQNEVSGIMINKFVIKDGFELNNLTPLQIDSGENLTMNYLSNERYYGKDADPDYRGDEIGDLKIATVTDQTPEYIPYNNYLESGIKVLVRESVLDKVIENIEGVKDDKDGSSENVVEKYQVLYLIANDGTQLSKDLKDGIGKELGSSLSIYDLHELNSNNNQMMTLISVFAYGFIALITIICMANIFNNVSTSMALRRREFAVLKSVGMTPKAFKQMIYFESIFYGLKALIVSMPISLIIMFFIHDSLYSYFKTTFILPWGSIIVAVLAVFIIVLSAMLYSFAKIRKENIIDGLRIDNI